MADGRIANGRGKAGYQVNALIFQGGWEGHEPAKVAEILAGILREENFNVKITDSLAALEEDNLSDYDLIVPNWTQGTIYDNQLAALMKAVEEGTGLAGLHGGLGDSSEWRRIINLWSVVNGLLIPAMTMFDIKCILKTKTTRLPKGWKTSL